MEANENRQGTEYLLKVELQTIRKSEEKWESLAREVIVNFYGRSGTGRGNIDRLVDFKKDLPNLVGFALNCFRTADLSNPNDWNRFELSMAENGNKQFDFDDKGDSDVLKAMRESCENDEFNYFNVLPIIYRTESSLFFTPLFRLRRFMDNQPHFVDGKGRIYDDFEDWEQNNSLPDYCAFIFPTNGILNGSSVTKRTKDNDGTSEFIETTAEIVDKFVGPLGSFIISPMQAAKPIYEIYDRATHGESINPFGDNEAATLWFSISSKLTGPVGKMAELLGNAALKKGKKQTKSEKILDDSVTNLRNFLSDGNKTQSAENIVTDSLSFIDNPMTIKVRFNFQSIDHIYHLILLGHDEAFKVLL